MIIPSDKRIASRASVGGFRSGSYYAGANPSGPTGSNLMTFFCVFQPERLPTGTQVLFGRSTLAADGWLFWSSGTSLFTSVRNGVGAFVNNTLVIAPPFVPTVLIARYNNGTLETWANALTSGASTSGTGYTSVATRTTIGVRDNLLQEAIDYTVFAAGMLDTFDVAATIATVNGQWQEDLQQGRYLTDPSAGALGANLWYWDARNAGATWIDRGPNAVSLARTGAPQLGCSRMVF